MPRDETFLMHPSLRDQFQSHIGSIIGHEGVVWSPAKLAKIQDSWRVHYGPARFDPMLIRLMAEARTQRLPKDEKLLTVMGNEVI